MLPVRRLILATLMNSIAAVGVQLIAVATLGAVDYGWFSVPYLIVAFSNSLLLSTVCEPWVRRHLQGAMKRPWAEYSFMSLGIAVLGGVVVLVACLVSPVLRSLAIPVAVAAVTSLYRSGARFYSLYDRNWKHVVVGDCVGACLTIVLGIGVVVRANESLGEIVIAWMVICVGQAVTSRLPRLQRLATFGGWFRQHRTEIVPLLRDTLIMDISMIGTPFLLIPFLDISGFGTYRALSSVGAPVRLLVNPLRPYIGRIALNTLTGPRFLRIVLTASALLGIAGVAGVAFLEWSGLSLGTLETLFPFMLAVGIYLAANTVAQVFYVVARQHCGERALLRARVVQTAAYVLFPILGAVSLGLPGAIYGYVLGTIATALAWLAVSRGFSRCR